MPEDKDEFWDKKLSVYTEKDEITKYESYREYPAIVKIVNNQPKVFLDIKFELSIARISIYIAQAYVTKAS